MGKSRRRVLQFSAVASVVGSALYAVVLFHAMKEFARTIPTAVEVVVRRLEEGILTTLQARACLVDPHPNEQLQSEVLHSERDDPNSAIQPDSATRRR